MTGALEVFLRQRECAAAFWRSVVPATMKADLTRLFRDELRGSYTPRVPEWVEHLRAGEWKTDSLYMRTLLERRDRRAPAHIRELREGAWVTPWISIRYPVLDVPEPWSALDYDARVKRHEARGVDVAATLRDLATDHTVLVPELCVKACGCPDNGQRCIHSPMPGVDYSGFTWLGLDRTTPTLHITREEMERAAAREPGATWRALFTELQCPACFQVGPCASDVCEHPCKTKR